MPAERVPPAVIRKARRMRIGVRAPDHQVLRSVFRPEQCLPRTVYKSDLRHYVLFRYIVLHRVRDNILPVGLGLPRVGLRDDNRSFFLCRGFSVDRLQLRASRAAHDDLLLGPVADRHAVELPVPEHLPDNLRRREGHAAADPRRHGHALLQLGRAVRIAHVHAVRLLLGDIAGYNQDGFPALHGCPDALVRRYRLCRIAFRVRYVPVLKHLAHLRRRDCREGNALAARIALRGNDLRVRVPEYNQHRARIPCRRADGADLRISDHIKGEVLLRGEDVPRPVHPVQELTPRVGEAQEHLLSGAVAPVRRPALLRPAVDGILRAVHLQRKAARGRRRVERDKAEVRVDDEAVALQAAEPGGIRRVRRVVPSDERVAVPGIRRHRGLRPVGVNAAAGQKRYASRRSNAARGQCENPVGVPVLSLLRVLIFFRFFRFPVCRLHRKVRLPVFAFLRFLRIGRWVRAFD